SDSPSRLVIRRPDDWHVHLRDGDMLKAVAGHTARPFGRAIVMPNLQPPMTAYLTDGTDPEDIARGFQAGILTACKLYPAHATTNSEHGVTDVARIARVLERMQDIGMPLLVHGEVTDPTVDIFDREAVFIDRVFSKIAADFPALK